MSNEQKGSDVEQTEVENKKIEPVHRAPTERAPASKERSGVVGAILMSLIILFMGVAGGVAAFFFWQFLSALDNEQAKITERVEHQSRVITPLSAQLDQFSDQHQAMQIKLSTLEQQVANVKKQSDTLLDKVSSLDGVHRNDWLIAEVEHYIKLANQRIELTHDAAGAARLLRQSVDVAKAVEVPGIIMLREALLADQHALLRVANVDVEAIYLELSVLNRQVEALVEPALKWSFESGSKEGAAPVKESGQGVDIGAKVQGEEQGEMEDGWQYAWMQWRRFFREHLVRYRKVESPVEPLMPPDQTAFLRQNIRLLISQAQLAVMRGDGDNYRVALQQAYDWIDQYYDVKAPATQGMLDALGRLVSINIQPKLPDVSRSLTSIRRLREHWMEIKQHDLMLRNRAQQGGQAVKKGVVFNAPASDDAELGGER